ncbi:MAG: hypothetical protein AB9891_21345 [Anaerolineaceae bacterium]
MRINPFLYGAAVLAVFFGVILGFQSAGIWSISGKVTGDGRAVQPSATDVNSIKGWMTLEQISTVYNVPLDELLGAINLPANTPAETAVKDLESDTFETENLREYLQSRIDGTVWPSADSVPVTIPLPVEMEDVTEAAPVELTPTPAPTEHVQPAGTVSGNTTFQDLDDWGVTADAVKTILGMDPPDPGISVRQFAVDNGLTFSEIKTLLQAEVDKSQ